MCDRLALIIVSAGLLVAGACSSAGTAPARAATPSPAAEAASPSMPPAVAAPTAPDTPAQSPAPAPAPTTVLVAFAGLPPGTYPVHLHTACNGSQAFHLAVLSSLSIGAGGGGGINVPVGDAGRGLCLVVYSDGSLSRVLTVRPI